MEVNEFSSLIDEYGNCIYKFCVGMTYTKEDAEDLYQQTFMTAFEKRRKIDRNNNPKAYLMSIAGTLWKNQKATYARHLRIAPTISYDEIEFDIAGETPDMSDLAIKDEESEMLRSGINKLPDKLKQVIVLFYSSELSIDEISKALHIPKGTVKSRLHNAKEQLRIIMESGVSP